MQQVQAGGGPPDPAQLGELLRQFQGGRGGAPPDWQRLANSRAFGNGRQNQRPLYTGMALFSLDDYVWDARNYSVTGAGVDKPAYANARYGVTFGGPLQIPKLISASKRINFTLDFQLQKNRTGVNSQGVNMPTGLERIGDFSQTLVQGKPVTIYDPTTGLPFAGNVIPLTRLNSAALALLNYFPNPNVDVASRNYQTSWTNSNDLHNLNFRLSNIRIGSKDRLNGGVGYQGSSGSSPSLFEFIDTSAGRSMNANLTWSRSITARLVNNVQFTFSRTRQLSSPFFAYGEDIASKLGIVGTAQNPFDFGPPNLNFTNYGSLTDGNYSLNRNQTGALGESLTWSHGVHNFSFGADYRRQQFNILSDSNGRGTYTFNGSATSLLVNGVAQTGTGYDLADFLLGAPSTSSIRYGNPDKYLRSTGYDAYINDDWRIRPTFSVQLGVRWDYSTPVTELYNRLINLDIAPGYSAISAVQSGQAGAYSVELPRALIRPDRNNFSPRFGFAWRPSTKHSLTVRGGYGIYYNSAAYQTIATNMAQQPPFAQTLSVSGSTTNQLNIQNAFLQATTDSSASTYAIDPNYRIGYAQSWNLTLQNNLPFGLYGTVGYQGTKGTRLDQQFIPNSVAPGLPASSLPHGFTYETSNGNSIYHAAQFQLNRRFRSGFSANTSYQFSKSIDDAGTGGRTPVAQNWLDLSGERALSSFDQRHNLQVQFQYSSGQGRAGGTLLSGWGAALLKDWTITGMYNIRSGTPFTATTGGNRSQLSGTAVSNTVRANATGLPVQAAGMLFNTAAFTAPAAGEWGNAGRNTIPGPTTFSLNGGMSRVFRLGERRSMDLQFQAQNVLNHVTINSWGTVVDSNTFGLATAAANMRKMTMNMRFRF